MKTRLSPTADYRVWGSHEPEILLPRPNEIRASLENDDVTLYYRLEDDQLIHELIDSMDEGIKAEHGWRIIEGHH